MRFRRVDVSPSLSLPFSIPFSSSPPLPRRPNNPKGDKEGRASQAMDTAGHIDHITVSPAGTATVTNTAQMPLRIHPRFSCFAVWCCGSSPTRPLAAIPLAQYPPLLLSAPLSPPCSWLPPSFDAEAEVEEDTDARAARSSAPAALSDPGVSSAPPCAGLRPCSCPDSSPPTLSSTLSETKSIVLPTCGGWWRARGDNTCGWDR